MRARGSEREASLPHWARELERGLPAPLGEGVGERSPCHVGEGVSEGPCRVGEGVSEGPCSVGEGMSESPCRIGEGVSESPYCMGEG